ncbi:hypothetical protein SAMN02745126_03777 [Enhydrobacter aerosaccus]|uniref:Uncharacterized protein n=1 Tax=Enhydrobacter aerosaccus TaxID=225324 RepID=A0A1T4RGX8_9HYPH|nr:hypothetical protein [Enhydrobacter aerosaccus]SKA15193.1 hypothetical protein SAMN02745126_03777 [Enhydrobacter aerosaccus]
MSKLRHMPYAALTAGSLLVGGGAYAQSMYGIDQRQAEQQQWISHGVSNGQLTPGETARLEQGQRSINRAQSYAEADGHVSPQERQRIDGMTNHEGREIYRDTHNDRTASGGRDGWGRDGGGHDRDAWRGRDGDRGREGWDRHDADRRDWNRDRDGWDRRQADGRDWGRDHNWNGNHYGWDQNSQHGWNGGQPGQPTPGSQHSWNGNPGQGGWQHGTGSGYQGNTPGSNGYGQAGGGWQHNGGAPATGAPAPTASTQHGWNSGQPRTVSYNGAGYNGATYNGAGYAANRSYTSGGYNGGNYGAGHSFGGRR